jgi:hypothetical protein
VKGFQDPAALRRHRASVDPWGEYANVPDPGARVGVISREEAVLRDFAAEAKPEAPMGGNAAVVTPALNCKKRCNSEVTIKTKAHEISHSSSGISLKTPVPAFRDTSGH